MSFGDAVHSVLSKYVCFTGRARRSEYWYFILFEMIVSAALTGVLNFIGTKIRTSRSFCPCSDSRFKMRT